MGTICACPPSASLTTIPVVDCPEDFGQIQKIAFQRLYKADGTKNGFTMPDDDIKLKANWTASLAATDSTKITISPYVQAPTAEPGAARTFGGGNDTLGGIEEVVGSEPTPFTGVFRKIPQSIIKIMKDYKCEYELGVYLFDQDGAIAAIQNGSTGTETYSPIPIQAFFLSDKGFGGLENPDYNNLQWSFPPGYSDNLVKIKPTDFNPLSDLRPVV